MNPVQVLVATDIFLNVAREEGELFKASESLLREIQSGRIKGHASAVTLAEAKLVFYEKGEYAKGDSIDSLIEEIVVLVPIDKEIAKQSVELKVRKRIDFFEAIHVVTAILLKAILITRDDELRKRVEDLVDVKTPEDIFFLMK